MYRNSFSEKEKLWKLLAMPGPLQERPPRELIAAILTFTLQSRAVFCAQLLTDWLSLTGIFKNDYYHYRINTPGTITPHNWSLVLPMPLEKLLVDPVTADIATMVRASGRR